MSTTKLQIQRIRVGKVNARFSDGYYTPIPHARNETDKHYLSIYPDDRDKPWKHELLLEIQWIIHPDADSYVLSPANCDTIDLQHTRCRRQNRFLFSVKSERLAEASSGENLFMLSAMRFVNRRREIISQSDPFELKLTPRFNTDELNCPICFEKYKACENVPAIDPPPNPDIKETDPEWKKQFRKNIYEQEVERRALQQSVRDRRASILDGVDILLCGHSFCQGCLDQMRGDGSTIPMTQFDIACPLCKETVPIE